MELRDIKGQIKKIILTNLKEGKTIIEEGWEAQLLYEELALDSFEAISIIVAIEDEFNIEMPDNWLAISFFDNLDSICEKIQRLVEACNDTIFGEE